MNHNSGCIVSAPVLHLTGGDLLGVGDSQSRRRLPSPLLKRGLSLLHSPVRHRSTVPTVTNTCSVSGDNYWVIDTDYDNYAITYACRSLKEDGSCDDGYSLIFSRNPRGLPPAIQRIVRQKQEEICMSGQFQPVLQSGTSSQPAEKCLHRQPAGEVNAFAVSVAELQQAKL